MRILWLSHLIPYPPKGGVLQRSYHLVKELSKYHEVDVLAFIQPNLTKPMFSSYEDGLKESKTELLKFCNHVEFIDIPCEQSKYGKYLLAVKSLFTFAPYTINWLKSKEYKNAIKRLTLNSDYDLVHADTISLAPYIELFDNAKTCLDHHNIESAMMLSRAEQDTNLFKKAYYYIEGLKLARSEKHFCPKFDVNITCSELDSERLREVTPEVNVVEIPNGVDIDFFQPLNGPKSPKTLVFAGGLTWYPNNQAMQYFAKDIWPVLKKEFPDITMNLIGKGPAENLLQLSKQDPNFKVLGFVDDVRPYIDSAMIYVCPILDGGGTKLKILDALAMGSALVANPPACEGIDIIDGEHALLADSAEDYLEKITLLFNDSKLRQQISANGRQLIVDQYAYSSIGKKLSDTFGGLFDS